MTVRRSQFPLYFVGRGVTESMQCETGREVSVSTDDTVCRAMQDVRKTVRRAVKTADRTDVDVQSVTNVVVARNIGSDSSVEVASSNQTTTIQQDGHDTSSPRRQE